LDQQSRKGKRVGLATYAPQKIFKVTISYEKLTVETNSKGVKKVKSIKVKYKQRMLELVEREIYKQEQRLNSAEVKIRQRQEEQKSLLNELCKLESGE